MSALDAWRRSVRGMIPRGFLRRDREDSGLLISDFIRYENADAVENALREARFIVWQLPNGLARIDASPEMYETLLSNLSCIRPTPEEDTLYLFALAERLIRAEVPLQEQPLPLLRLTLKALDAGAFDALTRKLSEETAVLQRKRLPLPSHAGWLIWQALAGQHQNSVCI